MAENVVGWFEVPVRNMERAIKFYETVLGLSLSPQDMGGVQMAWFPFAEGSGAPGSLILDENFYRPSATDGVLIYFTCPSGDLLNELARVEGAGGKVLQGKTLIAEEYGYLAICLDTEGNRIALHSAK